MTHVTARTGGLQANVTETFKLASGAVASDEQRRQDVILYRPPTPASPALPSGFVTDVSATFPITPSRTFAVADLVQGVVHLDILAGREAARGTVGGGLVTSGSARVVIPGCCLPVSAMPQELVSAAPLCDLSEGGGAQ